AAPLEQALAGPVPVIDPTRGLADLAAGNVRVISEEAFREDPLRPLRGVRLATELAFDLEPGTVELIRRYAADVSRAAAERQRDELVRILDTERAADGVRLLEEVSLLEVLLPDTAAMRGVEQPKEHYWDVWQHSVETLAALDRLLAASQPSGEPWATLWRLLRDELGWLADELRGYLDEPISADHRRIAIVKLGGLLHDIAKPQTKALDETGRIRFFGHPEQGAEKAAAMMRRLRFAGREVEFVSTMVDAHLRPVQLGQQGLPTRRALYRLFRDCGEATLAVLLLSLADHLGSVGPRLNLAGWRTHLGLINYILAEQRRDDSLVAPARLVSGHDLMQELQIEPGPTLGRLLESVREARAAGEVTTKEEALALARRELGAIAEPNTSRGRNRSK
ncbi:MAG TPA: HD domain-containing protein, partial [Dehalococcoidia bacterium]|nr:HD domain-containing protein [Dehalococcoidia bacterium]